MGQLLQFGVFIVIVIGIIVYAKRKEKQRSLDLSKIAEKLGFDFQKVTESTHLERYRDFQLFTKGGSKQTKNRMSHASNSLSSEIFGYQYTTSNGKNSSTHHHTVVSFYNAEYTFPDFELVPEHIFHKVGTIFGLQDIDFESHPKFSKKYLLQGKNVQPIKKLFNAELLYFLQDHPLVCIQAVGNTIIIYERYKRVKPEDIENFYRVAKLTYQQFCSSSGT